MINTTSTFTHAEQSHFYPLPPTAYTHSHSLTADTYLNHIPHDIVIEGASHGRGADGHLQLQNAHQHHLVAARVRRLKAAPRDGVGNERDRRDAAGAVRG
jgi:hypothetical protein